MAEKKGIEKRYLQLMWLCFFAYMISYFGRLGYNTNIPNFMESYKITSEQAGFATSAFFFCYGAGQFINGMLCEKMNSVRIITFSLLMSAIISLSLFFIENIIIITVLWGLNGLLLSTLWCNLVKITTLIQDEKYLKKSITVLAVSLPVGTLLAYGVSALLTYLGAWRIYFISSSIVLGVGGVFFFFAVEKIQKDIANFSAPIISIEEVKKAQAEGGSSLLKFLSLSIIPIFAVMVLCSLVKDGVQTWMPNFLNENYEMPTYFSILVTLVLSAFGLFAAMIAKKIVDKIKDVFLASALVFLFAGAIIGVFALLGKITVVIPIFAFALLSLSMHIVNTNFTAIFPIYYSKRVKSGQAAGILNCFAYVGSTLSGFLLGSIVDDYGWTVFIFVLLGCVVASVGFSILGYFLMKKKKFN